MFLEISQNSQKNTCARVSFFNSVAGLRNFAKFTGKHLCQSIFFNKVAGLRPSTLLKKRLWQTCFPVNYAKFPRAPFIQNASGGCYLKPGSTIFYQIFIFSPNDSHSKTIKNVFYFIEKALFVLETFIFL